MAGGIGSFVAGLEEMSFIASLSDRFEMSPQTVIRVIAVIFGVLVCVLAWLFVSQHDGQAEEILELETESSFGQLSTEFDSDTATPHTTAIETTQTQKAVVYVTGAVVSPGLYNLTNDDRIGDAVQAAGGLLPEAATAVVNLAQQISDGMQIHIPRMDEVQTDGPASSTTSSSQTASSLAHDNESATLVNINTADSAALQTLDGIGPATAQKIIDYRSAHGPFQSKDELKNVSGIGEKKYAALEARITV